MYTKVPLFGLHNEVGIIYSVLIDKILLWGVTSKAKTNHFQGFHPITKKGKIRQ